jgi:hypothetical protein
MHISDLMFMHLAFALHDPDTSIEWRKPLAWEVDSRMDRTRCNAEQKDEYFLKHEWHVS